MSTDSESNQISHVVDPTKIADLKKLDTVDTPFLLPVIETYLDKSVQMMAHIEKAVAEKDPIALEGTAHKLKGSSGNFGAKMLVKTLMQLEKLGQNWTVDGSAELFVEVRVEYDLVCRELNRLKETL